jgi:uncharacterized protein YdaU (DUF1376 family)
MNFYPHHIGDFNNATRHLTRIERSVYRDAIEMYYDTELPLMLDVEALTRKLMAKSSEEATAVEQVLNEFFTKTQQGWHHNRCELEIAEYRNGVSAKSIAGKASAAKRAKDRVERLEILNGSSTSVQHVLDSVGSFVQLTKNQEPRTKNQINTIVSGDAADLIQIASTSKPTCPHQSIIDLYHAELPVCPRIKDWTPARQTHLRARWNEDTERQDLDYWQRLFGYIATCDFLVGKGGGTRPFFAGLEWIVKSENFAKIREGKYQNNENRG